jgi:hypothetical protein
MTPTAPEVTRLKPCPFCGEQPVLEEVPDSTSWEKLYHIACVNKKGCGMQPATHPFTMAAFNMFAFNWDARSRNSDHASDPEKWAQQNPEAWEALRTGRAAVVPLELFRSAAGALIYGDPRNDPGLISVSLARMDTPFKSEVKEGV